MEVFNEVMSEFDIKFHSVIKLYKERFKSLISDLGLFPGQPPVLLFLLKHNECTQNELCKLINIRPASMTDILKRMEKAQLIERRADEKDLRISRVFISPKGRELASTVLVIIKELEEKCFSDFTEEEKKTFLCLIDKFKIGLTQSKL